MLWLDANKPEEPPHSENNVKCTDIETQEPNVTKKFMLLNPHAENLTKNKHIEPPEAESPQQTYVLMALMLKS